MSKRLGNNPLKDDDSPLRPTIDPELDQSKQAEVKEGPVSKSLQLDSKLNDRLRKYAFEKRKKEVQIIREALHQLLAKEGF